MDILKAKLCATLSKNTYNDDTTKTRQQFTDLGFPNIKFFNNSSSQAYVVHNKKEIYVIYRGTELDEIKDITRNGMIWPTRGQKQGRVHSGFAEATDKIWDQLNSYLKEEVQKYKMADAVIFTGHSLGGAMAIISAARSDYIADIYTFGAPRAGNREYSRNIKSRSYRITNGHDIIPLILPPIGYHHGGIEYRMFDDDIHMVHSYLESWKFQIKIGMRKLVKLLWFRSLILDHRIGEYEQNLKSFKLLP